MRKPSSTRRTTALLLTAAIVGALTVATASVADMVSPTVPAASAAPVAGGLGFTPLATPCRAVDTRSGGGALGPDTTRSFQVGGAGNLAAQGGAAGGCGVPDGAGAVEVAITAVGPAGSGFLRAFAAGDAVPSATFVNYTSGVGITNTGTVPLAAAGTQDLSVKNFGGTTHVVVDVLGYFTTAGSGGYTPLASPCRAVDTRLTAGGPVAAGASRNVQVAGAGNLSAQGGAAGGCGVPDGVPAAVVSITAVGPSGSGFLRAGPNTGTPPAATVVNYTNGVSITNTGAVALGSAALADLSLAGFAGSTHVAVDVLGYYSPAAGSRYQTLTPCRVVDTRFAPGGRMTADTTRLFQVGGERNWFAAQGTTAVTGCGVPDRAAAVAAAVTAVTPEGNGFARLFPAGGAATGTFLNFTTGRSVTNAGALPLANGGLQDLALKDFGATSHFVVDVLGYYEPPAASPNPAAHLGAGYEHSCVVGVFGTVSCWGRNTNGQLGLGTTTSRSTPTQVPGLYGALSTVSGDRHSCALMSGGTVKCWGRNSDGQLGDGTITTRTAPVDVSGISTVVSLVAGADHTCALMANRTVTCWGNNIDGQLGDGTTTDQTTPTGVIELSGVALLTSARSDHTCALLVDGSAKCWGYNDSGQLGNSSTTSANRPVVVSGLSSAVSMTAGRDHTCALLAAGTARCWGENSQGQVGDGTTLVDRLVPTAVVGLSGAVAVATGYGHSCAVLVDGTAKCWGYNGFGQLGDGTTTDRATPTVVSGLTTAVAIGGAGFRTCAVLSSGAPKCWGDNAAGQVGDGTGSSRTVPTAVSGFTGAVAVASGAAGEHTCALLAGGTAKCWGNNNLGQVGDGTTTNRSTPVTVTGLAGAVAISAGASHSCALIFDGTARCWGENVSGQIGDGTLVDRQVATRVTGLVGAVAISTGTFHTCALVVDGTARCWGLNLDGQVGDGTITSRRQVPTAVTGLTGATAISAGGGHTCARRNDSSVRCWGRNDDGEIGNNTLIDSAEPAAVSGPSSALTVVAGDFHTCAVLNDGSASCWGRNDLGQLGDGTTTDRQVPTAASGLFGVASLGAGNDHTCALLADGTARCWGDNLSGQLGDGTTSQRLTPVAVFGLAGAVAISASTSHTCAVLADGATRCWGDNAFSQLGDGTTTDRLTPTAVFGLG